MGQETVETRPDQSTYSVYTNFLGEVLLTDLYDPASGQDSYGYRQYGQYALDGNGPSLVEEAQPSAIDGAPKPDVYGNLNVTLYTGQGLIQTYDYYSTTAGEPTPAREAL